MRSRWVLPALLAAMGVGLATAAQAVAAPSPSPSTATDAVRASAATPAESNGIAANAPLMGWSAWGFLQRAPTAATFDAQAKALVTTGLSSLGYVYANLDDFWYQ